MGNDEFNNRIFIASLLFSLWIASVGFAAENKNGSWLWLILLVLSVVGMYFLYSKLYPLLWGFFIGSLAGLFSCGVCGSLNLNLTNLMWVVSTALGAFTIYLIFSALGIRFKKS